MPASSTPSIFNSDGLVIGRLPNVTVATSSTLADGTPSLTTPVRTVQNIDPTTPGSDESRISESSTTTTGPSMINTPMTTSTILTATPVDTVASPMLSSTSSTMMPPTVALSIAGSSAMPTESEDVTAQPQSASVTPGKTKNATIGIVVGSLMGLLLIVLALLYLKRYVYRQRQSEDFNSKFHFRRTAGGGIVRKVDDRRFIAEFPGSRTTVVETFADDGAHIDDVHISGKHSSGVVSWTSVDEESKVSLVDFRGLSYGMSPSPSSNGVDTISSRQTPTNPPLTRTPDTIPHTNQEET